jgi:hypothetical protein
MKKATSLPRSITQRPPTFLAGRTNYRLVGFRLHEHAGELAGEELGLTAAGELHDGDVVALVGDLGDLALRSLEGDFVFAAHDRFPFAYEQFLFINKPE